MRLEGILSISFRATYATKLTDRDNQVENLDYAIESADDGEPEARYIPKNAKIIQTFLHLVS